MIDAAAGRRPAAGVKKIAFFGVRVVVVVSSRSEAVVRKHARRAHVFVAAGAPLEAGQAATAGGPFQLGIPVRISLAELKVGRIWVPGSRSVTTGLTPHMRIH